MLQKIVDTYKHYGLSIECTFYLRFFTRTINTTNPANNNIGIISTLQPCPKINIPVVTVVVVVVVTFPPPPKQIVVFTIDIKEIINNITKILFIFNISSPSLSPYN